MPSNDISSNFSINHELVSRASNLVLASHNPELAEYMNTLLLEKIKSNRAENTYADFIIKQKDFEELVNNLNNGVDNHWFGGDVASDYQKFHENLSKKQIEVIDSYITAGEKNAFDMYFSLGQDAEFLRAYQINNKPADKKFNEAMDQMFSTWLSKNHWMNKDGFICEVDPQNSSVKLDRNNKPVRANIDDVREAFYKDNAGFKNFLTNKNKSLVEINFHEQKAQPSAQPQASKA